VTRINWKNDGVLTKGEFQQGLQVTLDASPDPKSVTPATFIVTIEEPVGAGVAQPSIVLPATGSPSVSGDVITWKPDTALAARLMAGVRVRVTLKGHCIWSPTGDPQAYLDGQAFGEPLPVSDTRTIISLALPSGDGGRASDFESWFTLVPTPQLTATVITAAPLNIRREGLSELVSDVVLLFTGGIPTPRGLPVPQVNITLSFNTNVTSRLFLGRFQDAVLLIDDPALLNNSSTIPAPLGVGGSGLDFHAGQAPNVIIGSHATDATDQVTFVAVPLDQPGTGQRTMRMTNLRVNAHGLGASLADGSGTVTVNVSIEGGIDAGSGTSVSFPNPHQTVGTVQPATVSKVIPLTGSGPGSAPANINPALGVNTDLVTHPASNTGLINLLLQFNGSFPDAFKPLTHLPRPPIGSPYQGEESFDRIGLSFATGVPPFPSTEPTGIADQGTLFVARFENIPAGLQVFVTTRDLPGSGISGGDPNQPSPEAVLVTSEGGGVTPPPGVPRGTGGVTAGPAPFSGIPIAAIPLTNGEGEAVWQWVAELKGSIQTPQFGVLLALPAGSSNVTGSATVNLSLGPRSTVASASQGDFIPRFADTSVPISFFTVH
jgi:hypothetical protein